MEKERNLRLRQDMAMGSALLIPGAGSALTARMIEDAGFKTLLVTGAGVANTYLGVPDIGLVSLKEAVDNVWAIRDAVSLPIVVDADTGFGNAVNVGRTVRMMERAGASAIMLEDQVFPKKCGHFEGKAVISKQEMVQKIRAAADARQDDNMMIIGRTDARAVEGFEAAIERVQAYEEAGADILFVESPTSIEEMIAIPKLVKNRHICNLVVGGKTPLLSRERLAELGYAGIYYANAPLQAAVYGMKLVLAELARSGSIEAVQDKLISFQERQRFVNFDRYAELEARYAAGPDALKAAQ